VTPEQRAKEFLARLTGGATVLNAAGPGLPVDPGGPLGVLPPPGSYDPNLDYELAAAGRGLQQLVDDTGTGQNRLLAHYLLDQKGIENERDLSMAELDAAAKERVAGYRNQLETSLESLLKQEQYGKEDIPREATRARENLGLQLGDLLRGYSNREASQTGAIRQSGVGGGALIQAAAARAGNLAADRHGIDLQSGRVNEDETRNLNRLNVAVYGARENARSNFERSLAAAMSSQDASKLRINRTAEQQLAGLGLGYNEGSEDLTRTVTRAQLEYPFYVAQVNSVKGSQAGANGFDPQSAVVKGSANPLASALGVAPTKSQATALAGASIMHPLVWDPKTGKYVRR
jgi:hypothetical protein